MRVHVKSQKLLLLISCLLMCSSVWAADWNASFSPALVSSFVDPDAVLLVVSAGTPATEARAAARGLEMAARTRAHLVMDSAALGNVSANADEVIRQNAMAQPWTLLAIVRAFPGRTAATAVIVVYDKAGAVRASMTATRGELAVLRPSGAGMSPSELSGPGSTDVPSVRPPLVQADVSAGPAVPPTEIPVAVEGTDAQNSAAQAEYDANKIHFGQVLKRDWPARAFDGTWLGPNRVSTEVVYEKLGRRDLIDARRSRAALKLALGIGAGAAFVGTATAVCVPFGFAAGWCQPRTEAIIVGASVGALGVGLLVAAIAIPSEGISSKALVELIERHNVALKEKLGLTSLQFVPRFDSRGAGLQMVATF